MSCVRFDWSRSLAIGHVFVLVVVRACVAADVSDVRAVVVAVVAVVRLVADGAPVVIDRVIIAVVVVVVVVLVNKVLSGFEVVQSASYCPAGSRPPAHSARPSSRLHLRPSFDQSFIRRCQHGRRNQICQWLCVCLCA